VNEPISDGEEILVREVIYQPNKKIIKAQSIFNFTGECVIYVDFMITQQILPIQLNGKSEMSK
jgi:hypothetical protein